MNSASEWPMVKLGEVAEIRTAQIKPESLDGGTFYLGLEHLKKEGGILEKSDVATAGLKSSKYTFTDEAVLFGKLRPNLRKVATPEFSGICSTDILPIYPSETVNRSFLYHYLLSEPAQAFIRNRVTGINLPRTSPKALRELPISLPPLTEQQRIAGVLNQTTSILELARQEVRKIDESRSTLFESLFPLSTYPASNIGNFLSETQYGSSKKSGEAGKYPMLRMGNLSSTGSISYSDLKYLDLEEKEINKYTLRNRDILFNRTNSKELVGKTAVYYGENDQVAYAGYLIRCRTNDLATPEFISGFLNSRIGKAQLFQRAKSIVGMANINAKELRTLRIPSVPVEEQEKYTSASQQLEDLRLAVEKKVEKLEELQKPLSTRAFAGHL